MQSNTINVSSVQGKSSVMNNEKNKRGISSAISSLLFFLKIFLCILIIKCRSLKKQTLIMINLFSFVFLFIFNVTIGESARHVHTSYTHTQTHTHTHMRLHAHIHESERDMRRAYISFDNY